MFLHKDSLNRKSQIHVYGRHGCSFRAFNSRGTCLCVGSCSLNGLMDSLEYCPTNPECVVSTGEEGGVYLFDFQKQPLSPIDSIMHPEASYTGQLATCKTLSWSCHNEQISAGGEDGAICVWDASVPSKYIVRYSHHQQSVLVSDFVVDLLFIINLEFSLESASRRPDF